MSDNSELSNLVRIVAPKIDRPLVLVGLMGAGKSRIGKMLSDSIDIPFVDSDIELVSAARCSIPEIFDRFGEEFFRDAERRVMKRLINDGIQVISTGGGAFINPQTNALVKEKAISIWLRVEPELLAKRVVKNRDNRPLLKGRDALEVMKSLAEERYPVYEQADIIVDSYDVPHESTLISVMEKLDALLNRS